MARQQAEQDRDAAQLGWERECQDGDRVLAALELDRTEGGWMNAGHVVEAIHKLMAERDGYCDRWLDEKKQAEAEVSDLRAQLQRAGEKIQALERTLRASLDEFAMRKLRDEAADLRAQIARLQVDRAMRCVTCGTASYQPNDRCEMHHSVDDLIALWRTEQELHNAWEKRAYQAERELADQQGAK